MQTETPATPQSIIIRSSRHLVNVWRRPGFLIASVILNLLFLILSGQFLVDKYSQVIGSMYSKYIKEVTSQGYPSYYFQRIEVFTLLQENLKDKRIIIFAGDSLVEYFEWSEYLQGSSDAIFLNRGIGGDTIDRLSDRFDVTFLTEYSPQKIFIMVGINEISSGDFNEDQFLDKYYRLIDRLLIDVAPDRICVQSILPARRGNELNATVKKVNRHLKTYALDKRICYIDLFDKFVDTTGELDDRYQAMDGLHLTAEGYKVWLQEIKPLLRR